MTVDSLLTAVIWPFGGGWPQMLKNVPLATPKKTKEKSLCFYYVTEFSIQQMTVTCVDTKEGKVSQ